MGGQRALELFNGRKVEVVGRFIEHQNVGRLSA
jgi:hypothetical protein